MLKIINLLINNSSTFIYLICILLLLLYFRTKRKTRRNPPGPSGYPIVGNTFLLQNNAFKILFDLTKQYGPVFQFKFFGQPIIVLGDYELLKEVLLKHADVFSGRPKAYVLKAYSEDMGLIFSTGDLWREQRRFALTALRDFGFGKTSIEEKIVQEAHFMINEISQQNGRPFDPCLLLGKAISNVILCMSCNKRIEYDDKLYDILLQDADNIIKGFRMTNPINLFPPLRFFMKDWKEYTQSIDRVRNYFLEIIKEHRESFDVNNKRDFIDVFLQREFKDQNEKNRDSTFNDLQLIINMTDFFIAGTETTATMLRWAILYMMYYTDIQKKLQLEIDSVVGSSRTPTMADKPNLPYTEAFISELFRCVNLVPLAIVHTVDIDFNLQGYDIPKGSFILPNLTAVHFDPKYWKIPYKFDPSRFIEDNGSFKKFETLIPFSLGKRSCLGETLAKMEFFLFLIILVQHFTFEPPPSGYLPPLSECKDGSSLRPLSFEFCAITR